MTNKHILILGCAGFIGSHLCEHILAHTDWTISGMDLHSKNINHLLPNARLQFHAGDMTQSHDWLEAEIQKADAVLPLVAIANPALYVKDPLRVFELDFEANLAVVRLCVKYKKRVVFPSTSEVYGMCPDAEFDEEHSNFVQGPINKPRWIYSCSKQLMDRVIAAYAQRGELQYTLFRPFNFMGPRLDNLLAQQEGSSRAFTQFVGNVMRGQDIKLVDGGAQRRCYIYIDDAIEAIVKIIANENQCANQRIFNVGNPANNISMRELAEMVIAEMAKRPQFAEQASKVKLVDIPAAEYFGAGYQDVSARVPSIKAAKQYLNWQPNTSVLEGLQKTLSYYFD